MTVDQEKPPLTGTVSRAFKPRTPGHRAEWLLRARHAWLIETIKSGALDQMICTPRGRTFIQINVLFLHQLVLGEPLRAFQRACTAQPPTSSS